MAPEWERLWREDPHATPFQSPQWLLPWWRQFGTSELRTTTLRSGSRLIGLLPLYIYEEEPARTSVERGLRKLLLLGSGTSDYLDGVFAPDCAVEHVSAAWDWMAEKKLAEDAWDCCDLMQVREESPLRKALEARAPAYETEACSRMPAVPIAGLPAKIRRNAMYYRNRAARQGSLELATATRNTCLRDFEILVELHRERWHAKQESGVLHDEGVLAWHREALPLLAQAGILRLRTLLLNGEPIAAMYGLVDPPAATGDGAAPRTEYLYLPGISMRHADLRPGTVLMAMISEAAAAEGATHLDLLRGDEAYKQHWHAERTPTWGLHLPSAVAEMPRKECVPPLEAVV